MKIAASIALAFWLYCLANVVVKRRSYDILSLVLWSLLILFGAGCSTWLILR